MTKQTFKTKRLLRRQLRRGRERRRRRKPTLTFTPTAWAKLRSLRDLGPTEVGGFGISAPENLLCIQDLQLVKQVCTSVTVKFDDLAVAEFFEEQVDLGRKPEQFGRIWIHTHPGSCPRPSAVDLRTFRRCFGRCDWAVMFILARNDSTSAELYWRPGDARFPMNVEVDFSRPFPGSDEPAWEAEYTATVHPECGEIVTQKENPSWKSDLHQEYAEMFQDGFVSEDHAEFPFLERRCHESSRPFHTTGIPRSAGQAA